MAELPKITPEEIAARERIGAAEAQKTQENQLLLGRMRDFAKGVLRGNTTDFLNFLQDAQYLNPFQAAQKVVERGMKTELKRLDAEKAGTVPENERQIGDIVLQKITGIKAGNSPQEEVGSMVSVGGAGKKVLGMAAAAASPLVLMKVLGGAEGKIANQAQRGMIVSAARMHGKDGVDAVKAAELADTTKVNTASIYNLTGAYPEEGFLKSILSDKDMKIIGNPRIGESKRLEEVISHPKLFEAYPELKDLQVKGTVRGAREGAFFEEFGKDPARIEVSGVSQNFLDQMRLKDTGTSAAEKDITSTLKHEIQHAIQAKEGWTPGGNIASQRTIDPVSVQEKINRARESGDAAQKAAADRFAPKLNELVKKDGENAFAKYSNLAGEQEARFTQLTEDMNQNEAASQLLRVLRSGATPQTWDTVPLPHPSISPKK